MLLNNGAEVPVYEYLRRLADEIENSGAEYDRCTVIYGSDVEIFVDSADDNADDRAISANTLLSLELAKHVVMKEFFPSRN